MNRFVLSALLLLSTGCQHARSFLQMDSNSSSPFLGLQLSVDASGSKPGRRSTDARSSILKASHKNEQSPDRTDKDTVIAVAGRNMDFVSTAKNRPQTSNLKYSLPALNLEDNPGEAAEVEDILSRISG